MDKKYGPEDIEKLLLTKEFSELYPEEKAYILEHIQGKDEYARMQALLDSYQRTDEAPKADHMRPLLMDRFERKHQKRGIIVWLNTFFASLSLNMKVWNPALRLAGLFLAIGLIWVFFFREPLVQNDSMAVEPEKIELDRQDPPQTQSDNSIVTIQDESTVTTSYESTSISEDAIQPEKDMILEDKLAPSVQIEREVMELAEEALATANQEIDLVEIEEAEVQLDNINLSDEIAGYSMNQTTATIIDNARSESDFQTEDEVAADLATESQRLLLTDDMISFLYTAP